MHNSKKSLWVLYFLLFFLLTIPGQAERIGTFVQVRGFLKAFDTDQNSLPIRLKVWNITQKRYVQEVWQPDPETGEFFVLLQESQTYTLSIQPRGFMPYQWVLHLPKDVFSYALEKELRFSPVKLDKLVVGQKAEVLSQEESFLYTYQIRDTTEIQEKKNAFLSDLLERLVQQADPYGMDNLGYWLEHYPKAEVQPVATAEEPIEDEKPLPMYDDLLDQLEEQIQGEKGKDLAQDIPVRDTELPAPQFRYYGEQNTTRYARAVSQVIDQDIFFPEGTHQVGRAQKKQLAELKDWLTDYASGALTVVLHVPQDASKVRIRRLSRQLPEHILSVNYLSDKEETVDTEMPVFPFVQPWCRFKVSVEQ